MLRPRILIQSGSYNLDNLGDQSMIASAISRIRERLPGATFSVVARSAEGLKSLATGARRVPVEDRGEWKLVRSLYLRLRASAPSIDPFIRSRFPGTFNRLLRLKARKLINHEALRETDFLIVSGGGYFNDVFPGQAWSTLERIRAADALGVPFALVGQSFGPLTDPALRKELAELLPRARLIALRERETSVPLLRELGVSEEKVFVTGDDTVESAWNARQDLQSYIGVNLRVAPYAGTSNADLESVRKGLEIIAAQTGADFISVPVCIADSVESSSDATATAAMLADLPGNGADATIPTSVKGLIARTSTCGIIVTGSYHGAVFALSQGIPAVCVYKSEYYRMKFLGLKGLFGSGCAMVSLSSERFAEELSTAAMKLWHDRLELRFPLLHAAEEQIASGRRAYEELCSIIAAHCATPRPPRTESAA